MSNPRLENTDLDATPSSTSDNGIEQSSAATVAPDQKVAPNRQPLVDKRARRRRIWKGLGLMTLMTGLGGYLYATQTKHGRDTTEVFTQGYHCLLYTSPSPRDS